MYTTCCLMMIHPYAKSWHAYIKEQRQSCPTQIHGKNKYLFDIEVKGHTKVMNVLNTLYHGDTLTSQTYYDYVLGHKSCGPNTKPYNKPY